MVAVGGNYAFLLLNGVHVILSEDIDGTEPLAWPNIALSPANSPLLQMIFNHLLIVHLEAGVESEAWSGRKH